MVELLKTVSDTIKESAIKVLEEELEIARKGKTKEVVVLCIGDEGELNWSYSASDNIPYLIGLLEATKYKLIERMHGEERTC